MRVWGSLLLCALTVGAVAACGRGSSETREVCDVRPPAEAQAGAAAPGLVFGDENEFPAEEEMPAADETRATAEAPRDVPPEPPIVRPPDRPFPTEPAPPLEPGWLEDMLRRLRKERRLREEYRLREERWERERHVPSSDDPENWCGTGLVGYSSRFTGVDIPSPGRWTPTREKGIYRRVVWEHTVAGTESRRSYEYGRRRGGVWSTWSATKERARRAKRDRDAAEGEAPSPR